MVTIATWNVNSLRVRLPQILTWLAARQPDIVALQEIKLQDAQFPLAEINEAGYEAVFAGQKTYNGVAILSKTAATEVQKGMPCFNDEQQRVLAATINGTRIINLYVPNGESVGSAKFDYKMQWLAQLQIWLQAELACYPQLVVLGDFNIAPGDNDVYDAEAWRGRVLCSEQERAAFQQLLQLGLVDSFRLHNQADADAYTWWDYRSAAIWRNEGLRIDHILLSQVLADYCQAVKIDVSERKRKRPSDHAPILAEILLA